MFKQFGLVCVFLFSHFNIFFPHSTVSFHLQLKLILIHWLISSLPHLSFELKIIASFLLIYCLFVNSLSLFILHIYWEVIICQALPMLDNSLNLCPQEDTSRNKQIKHLCNVLGLRQVPGRQWGLIDSGWGRRWNQLFFLSLDLSFTDGYLIYILVKCSENCIRIGIS